MRVNWLEYRNKRSNIRVRRVKFDEICLLTGLINSGTSMILEIIKMGKSILNRNYNEYMEYGIISFGLEIGENKYEWSIELGENEKDETSGLNRKIKILNEKLLINENIYIERKDNTIIYKGKEISGITEYLSVLNIFENDNEIKKVVSGFKNIVYIDESTKLNLNKYLLKENFEEKLKKVGELFCSINGNVESLIIKTNSNNKVKIYMVLKETESMLEFNEFNVSRAMIKLMNLLIYMNFCDDQSLFLIDEIENGLGFGCLYLILDVIKDNRNKYQFIMTTSHPYEMNNIEASNWNIISMFKNEIRSEKELLMR